MNTIPAGDGQRMIRAAAAGTCVLLLHAGIYMLLREQPHPFIPEPDGQVMEASIIELQRVPRLAHPVTEPAPAKLSTGALQLSAPDIQVTEVSVVSKRVERPVDLPSPHLNSGSSITEVWPPADPIAQVPPEQNAQTPIADAEVSNVETDVGTGGEVVASISVLVLPNGRILNVRVDESSGSPALDQAIRRYAFTWHLRPGTHAGEPRTMWSKFNVAAKIAPSNIRLRFCARQRATSFELCR